MTLSQIHDMRDNAETFLLNFNRFYKKCLCYHDADDMATMFFPCIIALQNVISSLKVLSDEYSKHEHKEK